MNKFCKLYIFAESDTFFSSLYKMNMNLMSDFGLITLELLFHFNLTNIIYISL